MQKHVLQKAFEKLCLHPAVMDGIYQDLFPKLNFQPFKNTKFFPAPKFLSWIPVESIPVLIYFRSTKTERKKYETESVSTLEMKTAFEVCFAKFFFLFFFVNNKCFCRKKRFYTTLAQCFFFHNIRDIRVWPLTMFNSA